MPNKQPMWNVDIWKCSSSLHTRFISKAPTGMCLGKSKNNFFLCSSPKTSKWKCATSICLSLVGGSDKNAEMLSEYCRFLQCRYLSRMALAQANKPASFHSMTIIFTATVVITHLKKECGVKYRKLGNAFY